MLTLKKLSIVLFNKDYTYLVNIIVLLLFLSLITHTFTDFTRNLLFPLPAVSLSPQAGIKNPRPAWLENPQEGLGILKKSPPTTLISIYFEIEETKRRILTSSQSTLRVSIN